MASVPPPPPRPEDETNPYAAPVAGIGPVAPDAPSGSAEAIRRSHISHEAAIKSIGVLYFLSCVLLIILGVVAFFGVAQPGVAAAEADGQAVLIGLGAFYLAFGVAFGVIGYGLRGLKPWARMSTVVLIFLGFLVSLGNVAYTAATNPSMVGPTLFGAVFGSLIPAYILYLMLSAKGKTVFSPEYKQIIAETPHVKYKTSCIVWGFLILLLVFIVLAIVGAIVGSMNG